jgi:hypothetical protein
MARKKYPMQKQAEKLAKQGRYGDSMLVHMNPVEVDVLRKTSPTGDLTTNPQTGQPEAFLQYLPFIAAGAQAVGAAKGSKTKTYDESVPVVQPSMQFTSADPASEFAARNLMDLYLNPQTGMITQPIPIPVRQVAGLSPLEVQARNLSQGLGGFGQQLSEAQDMFRQASQGFDPRSAGMFADPRARQLYEQSIGAYDPRMGSQFMDQGARAMQMGAAGGIGDAAGGIMDQVGGAQSGAMGATRRARRQVGQAGQALGRAGRMGIGAARQGIDQLRGTGRQFDPSSVSRFMDPFTQNVIDAQQAEIARLGEKQKLAAGDQAIGAGAFGGSRAAIAQAEIDRNTLEQQARTGAELRSQGFQQAQQAAQQAFEQAQGRRQQAAQLTGQLGQAGAQTGITAAGRAADLGLSAEQLAQRGALEGGQLGLSGLQGIGSLLGRQADIGAGLGRDFQSAQQLGSGIFGDQMARMQGAAGGMDRLTRGAMGDALSAFQAGQQGMRAGAAGIAGLGQQGFDMLRNQIGTLSDLGGIGRGIQDRAFGAEYQAATQQADEPFMRLQRGFQVLGQGQPFMPTFSSGFQTGQQGIGAYQKPNAFTRGAAALSFLTPFTSGGS